MDRQFGFGNICGVGSIDGDGHNDSSTSLDESIDGHGYLLSNCFECYYECNGSGDGYAYGFGSIYGYGNG